MISVELLSGADLHTILFADNAGVIVNPKGEMKGKSCMHLICSNSIHIDVSL